MPLLYLSISCAFLSLLLFRGFAARQLSSLTACRATSGTWKICPQEGGFQFCFSSIPPCFVSKVCGVFSLQVLSEDWHFLILFYQSLGLLLTTQKEVSMLGTGGFVRESMALEGSITPFIYTTFSNPLAVVYVFPPSLSLFLTLSPVHLKLSHLPFSSL